VDDGRGVDADKGVDVGRSVGVGRQVVDGCKSALLGPNKQLTKVDAVCNT
jgi:hypothetical protein